MFVKIMKLLLMAYFADIYPFSWTDDYNSTNEVICGSDSCSSGVCLSTVL
jgi:hypothetical protein